jgi:hypothetical protein
MDGNWTETRHKRTAIQNFIDQNRVLILSSSPQATNPALEASSVALPTPLGDEDEISVAIATVTAIQKHISE